ncbi:DUF4041 domain-containing protein [Pedococcus bigeumensis]|uniref:DUF4041 domain-containing protein n=1 Tax=Pedococcus bigeumensis TaxID=433644 RepID=UPI001F4F637C|nr:DUF4041 domain-containing protein [Pedococcus bigeumensis]
MDTRTRAERRADASPAPTVAPPSPSPAAVDTSVGLFGARGKARELGAEVERLTATNAEQTATLERLTAANAELTSQLRDMGALDVLELEKRRADATSQMEQERIAHQAAAAQEVAAHHATLAELLSRKVGLEAQIESIREELVTTRDDLVLQEVGVYQYTHPLDDSVAYKAELARITDRIKAMNRVGGGAVHGSTQITMNGNLGQGQKMVKEFSKLLLRAYNNEADNIVRGMRPYKLDSGKDRLTKAKGTIERLGKGMDIVIDPSYHRLRITEMELTADYIDKLAGEKEREKEERARLREERAAQAEFARQREKLERERTHYLNALASLEASGDIEAAERLRAELGEIDKAIEDVDYRAANIRAGYVYVISNLGAFGERMVKVGMTRRQDPMDRIKELSDASVPFNFDVHAIHFSNDAVGVEAEMHRRLADRRVNRVNLRREFFYATPAEVRDLLADVAGDLLEYTDSAEAFEYHQSVNDAEAPALTAPPAEPSEPVSSSTTV